MKLAELVSVFPKERQTQNLHFSRKQCQNFNVDISWYWACAVQHVCLLFAVWYVNGELNLLILLKEIFDKQDSRHQCSFLLQNFVHAQNSAELQKDNISFGVTIYW